MSDEPTTKPQGTRENLRVIDRYELHGEIAAGGMGTVHLGRLVGDAGFARPVAIKRLHPHLAHEADFVRMFVDEARLASRVRHPNVVQTLDVVRSGDELFHVMEYVHGAPLSALFSAAQRAKQELPLKIVSAIVSNVLQGLHAAHEAKDERGVGLSIVHRDVSPHNIMVGADGVSRLLDFGVLKARGRLSTTGGSGVLKGKLGYIPPEQLRNGEVTRLADVYAASVVLWELLALRRLYSGDSEANVIEQILVGLAPPPSRYQPNVPQELDELVLRGLDPDPDKRFPTARAMAMALERVVAPAPAMEVGYFVERMAGELLAERGALIAAIERESLPLEGGEGGEGDDGQQGEPRGESARADPSQKKAIDDLSSISVAGRRYERKGRRRGAYVVLAIVLFGGVAIAGWVWTKRPSIVPASIVASSATPTALATTTASEPSLAQKPTNAEGDSIAPPHASPKSAPIASKTAIASKPPSAKPTTSTTVSASSSTSVAAPSSSNGDECAVPYWWDKDGVRHYKRQCLSKN